SSDVCSSDLSGSRFVLSVKQRLDEGFCCKRLEVIDTLADPDKAHRQAEFLTQGKDHSTLGGAVQFGERYTRDARGIDKLLRLVYRVLAGAGIQHQQHFMGSAGIQLGH